MSGMVSAGAPASSASGTAHARGQAHAHATQPGVRGRAGASAGGAEGEATDAFSAMLQALDAGADQSGVAVTAQPVVDAKDSATKKTSHDETAAREALAAFALPLPTPIPLPTPALPTLVQHKATPDDENNAEQTLALLDQQSAHTSQTGIPSGEDRRAFIASLAEPGKANAKAVLDDPHPFIENTEAKTSATTDARIDSGESREAAQVNNQSLDFAMSSPIAAANHATSTHTSRTAVNERLASDNALTATTAATREAALEAPPAPPPPDPAAWASALAASMSHASHANASQASAAAVTHQASLPTHPLDAAFGGGLASEVRVMIDNGIQQADLHLNPADLGPIRIQLSITAQTADINFAAANQTTRQGIEQSLPALREMLAAQGLQLGDAGVNAGQHHHAHTDHREGATRAAKARSERASSSALSMGAAPITGRVAARAARGMLDLYA